MTDILIGVAGWAGAGKDTFADILVEDHGFVKLAFADPLREVAAALNPIVAIEEHSVIFEEHGYERVLREELRYVRYNDALERHGYNKAKFKYPEVRQLLQRIGTEAGRKIISDTLWIDMAMERAAQHERVVIADMRFQNEANCVLDHDGHTFKITRPGVGPANDHISEHDLDYWKFEEIIDNDGTPEDLHKKVEKIAVGYWNGP